MRCCAHGRMAGTGRRPLPRARHRSGDGACARRFADRVLRGLRGCRRSVRSLNALHSPMLQATVAPSVLQTPRHGAPSAPGAVGPLRLCRPPRAKIRAAPRPVRALRAMATPRVARAAGEYTWRPPATSREPLQRVHAFLPLRAPPSCTAKGARRSGRRGGERGFADARVRRLDIEAMRVVPRPGDAPIKLSVVHVDLYFFYGGRHRAAQRRAGGR